MPNERQMNARQAADLQTEWMLLDSARQLMGAIRAFFD